MEGSRLVLGELVFMAFWASQRVVLTATSARSAMAARMTSGIAMILSTSRLLIDCLHSRRATGRIDDRAHLVD